MSADLYVRTLGGTPEDQAAYMALQDDMFVWTDEIQALYDRVFGSWAGPAFWIGQVSWLKSSLDGDDKWIPSAVERVSVELQHGPVLTPGLAKTLQATLNLPNRSHYGRLEVLTDPEVVAVNWGASGLRRVRRGKHRQLIGRSRGVQRDRRAFKRWLAEHMGERLVAVSE